jgi:aconitate hydratase
MLIGAVNAENEEINKVKNYVTGEYGGVPEVRLDCIGFNFWIL